MDLALFDFDGTMTTGDTFTPFLRFSISPSRAILGGILISPVLIAHQLGLISAPRTRPIVARVGFQGVPAPILWERGRRYAAEILPTSIEPQAIERLRWHQRQGDTVAVVSAGLDVYLNSWCEVHGVTLICTELEVRNGRMTGRYRRGDCSGPTKAALIRATFDLDRFETIFAYGDTLEDREMLALAHRRYYRWQEIHDWGRDGRKYPCQ